MLVEWSKRPQDVANLLNPAFDGLLLRQAAIGYEKEAESGMPFELGSVGKLHYVSNLR